MLKDKVILVTGGAGRIGSAFCEGIVKNRAKVVIGDISLEQGRILEKKLSTSSAFFVETDVKNIDSIKNLIEEAEKKFGKVNSAVHCAYPVSKQWGASLEDIKPKELSEDLFSQLGSAILFSQQIIKYFRENKGGNLIHISSIQGISAPKFEHYKQTKMVSPIEYSAIKSGIIAITRYLSKYCREENIRVNCISPGGILDDQPEQFQSKYSDSCNSKGLLDAKDLVGALIFLLSKESEFIQGQNLIVDDGWNL